MKTYLTIYQNEERAAELEIRDQEDAPYLPSTVYAKIVDSSGAIVMAETAALLTSNTASVLVTADVSAVIGDYEIVWRILKNVSTTTYTFYHKTQLTIEEL